MEKIKLLIVDDHRILVAGLKKLFENSATVQVTGVAFSGKECRSAIIKELPDVISWSLYISPAIHWISK